MAELPEAGPSTRPSTNNHEKRPNLSRKRRKLAPPLPPKVKTSVPTQPLKTLQGVKTKRRDTTHPGYDRNVVFVTRKVSLGALIGRCKGLLVDEGFKFITIHAMAAAIPHALLLLHALLDLLPFSRRALWYEIRTGSTECTDQVESETRIGAVEEDAPSIEKRVKSTIQIDLHVGPRPRPPTAHGKKQRARLGKSARRALREKAHGHVGMGEEEMFYQTAADQVMDVQSEEEEEEIEDK